MASVVDGTRDHRRKPRIPLSRGLRTLLLMLWVRIGSLNGIAQEKPGGRWCPWLRGRIPSAETLGRTAAAADHGDLRRALVDHYQRRRRKKTLKPIAGKWWPLVFDGHESNASFLRSCPQCLKRTLKTKKGPRTQFYHRYVLAMLLHRDGALLMDLEPQRPGEDEMAAALRLLQRALLAYPQAFNLVGGDALYLNPDFCKLALAHGKHFIAVLKGEHRDLLVDARSLMASQAPISHRTKKTTSQWWDIEGFTTWTQLGHPVRVVRSVETRTVKRQRTRKLHSQTSEWLWATSLPKRSAPTRLVVQIGHGRWTIENEGFNQLANEWHADHVYKHDLDAMVTLWLLVCLAYNLFTVFLTTASPRLRRSPRRHQTAPADLPDPTGNTANPSANLATPKNRPTARGPLSFMSATAESLRGRSRP